MKISKYTFFFHINNVNYYVYNSLSNSLVEVDRYSYSVLKKDKNKGQLISIDLDKELYELLNKNGIITDNDLDDFLKYKAVVKKIRNQKSFMHLTLAPTMDCCFDCYYCFLKHKDEKYISSEMIDSVIAYIVAQEQVEIIKLTLFGGEPLMAINEIMEFHEKLSLRSNKIVNYDIITTGYHIDEKIIESFKIIGVKSAQITIDGMEATNNKVKSFPGSGNVFNIVWNNIKLMSELAPDIYVTIRVNLTKENAHEYKDLLEMFNKTFDNKTNVAIAPSYVLDRGSIDNNKCNSILFNHNERAEHMLELASKGIPTPYTKYPNHKIGECAIRNEIAISFDPEGYAYKCWEVIGDKTYAIGRLNDNGELIELNKKNINRQLYGAEPFEDTNCLKCKYMPICGGGCPIQRIQNKFENYTNNTCIYYKNYLVDFLKCHICKNSP